MGLQLRGRRGGEGKGAGKGRKGEKEGKWRAGVRIRPCMHTPVLLLVLVTLGSKD